MFVYEIRCDGIRRLLPKFFSIRHESPSARFWLCRHSLMVLGLDILATDPQITYYSLNGYLYIYVIGMVVGEYINEKRRNTIFSYFIKVNVQT
jgi:hypothetical protein